MRSRKNGITILPRILQEYRKNLEKFLQGFALIVMQHIISGWGIPKPYILNKL